MKQFTNTMNLIVNLSFNYLTNYIFCVWFSKIGHIYSGHKYMIHISSKMPSFILWIFQKIIYNVCVNLFSCYTYSFCYSKLLSLNFLFTGNTPLMKTKQACVNLHLKKKSEQSFKGNILSKECRISCRDLFTSPTSHNSLIISFCFCFFFFSSFSFPR